MVSDGIAIVAARLLGLVQLAEVLARDVPLHATVADDVLARGLGRRPGGCVRRRHLRGRRRLAGHWGRAARLRMGVGGRGSHAYFSQVAALGPARCVQVDTGCRYVCSCVWIHSARWAASGWARCVAGGLAGRGANDEVRRLALLIVERSIVIARCERRG